MIDMSEEFHTNMNATRNAVGDCLTNCGNYPDKISVCETFGCDYVSTCRDMYEANAWIREYLAKAKAKNTPQGEPG